MGTIPNTIIRINYSVYTANIDPRVQEKLNSYILVFSHYQNWHTMLIDKIKFIYQNKTDNIVFFSLMGPSKMENYLQGMKGRKFLQASLQLESMVYRAASKITKVYEEKMKEQSTEELRNYLIKNKECENTIKLKKKAPRKKLETRRKKIVRKNLKKKINRLSKKEEEPKKDVESTLTREEVRGSESNKSGPEKVKEQESKQEEIPVQKEEKAEVKITNIEKDTNIGSNEDIKSKSHVNQQVADVIRVPEIQGCNNEAVGEKKTPLEGKFDEISRIETYYEYDKGCMIRKEQKIDKNTVEQINTLEKMLKESDTIPAQHEEKKVVEQEKVDRTKFNKSRWLHQLNMGYSPISVGTYIDRINVGGKKYWYLERLAERLQSWNSLMASDYCSIIALLPYYYEVKYENLPEYEVIADLINKVKKDDPNYYNKINGKLNFNRPTLLDFLNFLRAIHHSDYGLIIVGANKNVYLDSQKQDTFILYKNHIEFNYGQPFKKLPIPNAEELIDEIRQQQPTTE
jgi:hypothetical protein